MDHHGFSFVKGQRVPELFPRGEDGSEAPERGAATRVGVPARSQVLTGWVEGQIDAMTLHEQILAEAAAVAAERIEQVDQPEWTGFPVVAVTKS